MVPQGQAWTQWGLEPDGPGREPGGLVLKGSVQDGLHEAALVLELLGGLEALAHHQTVECPRR
jgi:hypothetical protein